MLSITALTDVELQARPQLFLELVKQWAAGGSPPEPRHELCLRELPRPIFPDPATGREGLWEVLSFPQRARALAWLDHTGLLGELLPAWRGDLARRRLRLAAVEEVHLERWAAGLPRVAFEWLCVYQDQRVGRLGGWAVTGLSALLLEGDDPAPAFAALVRRDLNALGAFNSESERVLQAIAEYPELRAALLRGELPARAFSPTTIVGTLASLLAEPERSMDELRAAIQLAGRLLMRFAAPDSEPARTKKR